MKTNKINIAMLGLMGFSVCANGADYCMDTMRENLQPSNSVTENISKRKREVEIESTTPPSKIQRAQTNKNVPSLLIDKEISEINTQSEISLDQFIAEGLARYPLPTIEIVQDDLLESGFLDNLDKWIDEAVTKKDIHAMIVIGGLYHSNMDFDKAKPFIFWGANEKNGEAFWLLNCMWRKKGLENANEALGKALLNKAKELKSENAAIYLEEII